MRIPTTTSLRLLFALPPAPCQTPRRGMAALLTRGHDLLCAIPNVQLTEDQRRRVSGYLFDRGPLLVFHLARALRRSDVFPEHQGEADRLDEELRRAAAWLCLRNLFFELGRRCDVQHQLQRATTVHRALGVLRRLKDDPAAQRASLVAPAQQVLLAWQKHLRARKKR